MKNNNIILAGVARSGSTLSCYLLNKTSDTVALHEPIIPTNVPVSSSEETLKYLSLFFQDQRVSLLKAGIAQSKSQKGKVPDNPMGGICKESGVRKRKLDGDKITVTKALNESFILVVKQPGLFTGMLGLLKNHFPCYATVRNPLAILRSWNTVNMAVTDGHAPAAEQCDPVLKAILEVEDDRFNRQVLLLSWYYEQFYKHLCDDNIIYYEEVIRSRGKVLTCISPSASILNESLSSKNNNHIYDVEIKEQLASRLLNYDGFYWKFYSRKDVLSLLNE